MREFWIVLLLLVVVPLAGCDTVATMFSAALWIPGLFLVLIIWFAAFIAFRVRGG